jgi:type VI secretion system protein ImpI
MPLQLQIVSEHEDMLEEDSTRVFGEDGGTIGRSLESDWILPDPQRYLSGKHATIDFQSGAYYLADVSTNGVYVNDEEEPLGKGNPRRLFSGDRLRMGDFSFAVDLDEGQGLDMPPPEAMTVVPDHIEQLVQEEILKSGVQLLDEEAITGDAEFESALFGVKEEVETEKKDAQMSKPNPFAPAPTEAQQTAIDTAQLLDAFMKGLDITRAEIHPSTDALEVMENAGRVLKEFVDGATELLASRTALKSMFRLDQTTVLARHNNPLKLAENTRDSLQQNFDKTLKKKPLFSAMNQIKYWQLYCDLYPIMTQAGSGKLPHQFGEEFVRSYEKHLAEYKRLERKGDSQKVRPVNDHVPQETYDAEELVDQTEEAGYGDQF